MGLHRLTIPAVKHTDGGSDARYGRSPFVPSDRHQNFQHFRRVSRSKSVSLLPFSAVTLLREPGGRPAFSRLPPPAMTKLSGYAGDGRRGYGPDPQYLTKRGVQISAIWSMVLRVTGQFN
jgi:hypothetical protein